MKKYNYGKGWFNESRRHSLARQGVRTGKKVNYQKDIPISGVTFQPTEVSIEPELKEKSVMPDVDKIVTEEERLVEEPIIETEVEVPKEEVKLTLDDEIDKDLSELESEHEPKLIGKPWGDKVREKAKDLFKKGIQAYKDRSVSGIETHLTDLEEEKLQVQDRVSLLETLKTKIKSKDYRDEVGVSKQLEQLKRVNNIMGEPRKHLNTVNRTITELERRKSILLSPKAQEQIRKKKKEERIIPGFGDVFSVISPWQKK